MRTRNDRMVLFFTALQTLLIVSMERGGWQFFGMWAIALLNWAHGYDEGMGKCIERMQILKEAAEKALRNV